ncbi:MAG: TIGR01244 family sulfur transferase [Planktomarina sp.]
MNIRPLTPDYAVSPQIDPSDIAAIAEAGYKSIICNRPDNEAMPGQDQSAIKAAAETAGLAFGSNPFNHMQFGEEVIARQCELLQSLPGPVFAYCASGNRSSMAWSFCVVKDMGVEGIMKTTSAQGYNLEQLAPALEAFAQRG